MYSISIRQCSRIFSCGEISALLAISLLFQLRSGDIEFKSLHYQIFEFDIIIRYQFGLFAAQTEKGNFEAKVTCQQEIFFFTYLAVTSVGIYFELHHIYLLPL